MGLLSQSQIIWEIQSHLIWNLTDLFGSLRDLRIAAAHPFSTDRPAVSIAGKHYSHRPFGNTYTRASWGEILNVRS